MNILFLQAEPIQKHLFLSVCCLSELACEDDICTVPPILHAFVHFYFRRKSIYSVSSSSDTCVSLDSVFSYWLIFNLESLFLLDGRKSVQSVHSVQCVQRVQQLTLQNGTREFISPLRTFGRGTPFPRYCEAGQ